MSSETRKTQITHLLANPSLKHREIAEAIGCSTKTVQRVAKEIQPSVKEVEGKLEEYQRLLGKKLPIRDRVELYDRIARKAESNPFAAMRALERADDLDGILTAKDRSREPEPAKEPQPIFVMPPNTSVQVNLYQGACERKAIDITPERNSEQGDSLMPQKGNG